MADIELSIVVHDPDTLGVIEHPTLSKTALRKFAEAVLAGQKTADAAQAAGLDLKAVAKGGKRVREALDALRADYTASPDQIRELVTMQWLQDALTTADPRHRMAALKELSLIPEVGLKPSRGVSGVNRELDPATLALLDEQ